MATVGGGTQYKFNMQKDIKHNSNILTNERFSWLFLALDQNSIEMNLTKTPESIKQTYSVLMQIWKNVRCFFYFDPQARREVRIDTKDEGIYVLDVALERVNLLIIYAENNVWDTRKAGIISDQLNSIEVWIRNCMQYFKYFAQSTFNQKPDILNAAEEWYNKCDDMTVDELKSIVGKNNKIPWEKLGDVYPEDLENIDTELPDSQIEDEDSDETN